MIYLRVTKAGKVGKDGRGNVTSLCGGWGKVGKTAAIRHINNDDIRFYVELVDGKKVRVKVVEREGREYLRTSRDWNKRNNLLNLPPC